MTAYDKLNQRGWRSHLEIFARQHTLLGRAPLAALRGAGAIAAHATFFIASIARTEGLVGQDGALGDAKPRAVHAEVFAVIAAFDLDKNMEVMNRDNW